MSAPRKLLPGELARVTEHLLRLDPQSRADRFSGQISDQSIMSYVQGIDLSRDLMLVWFVEGELRATAHLALTRAFWPREAELALTVEAPWQDQGIGTELCREALIAARNRMIGRVWLVCLMENRRMQRIVRKLEGGLLYLDGAVEGGISLLPPDGLSLWHEAFGDGGALVETLFDRWQPVRLQSAGAIKARGRHRAA